MDIKQITIKLESIENEISNAEKRKSNLEGKQESIIEKLKSDFNISENEIDNLLDESKSKLVSLELEIEKDIKEMDTL